MGNYWYLYVLPIIGGIIWWLLSSALVRIPGNLLQNNFAKLTEDTNGVLAGKTLDEVKAACGDRAQYLRSAMVKCYINGRQRGIILRSFLMKTMFASEFVRRSQFNLHLLYR